MDKVLLIQTAFTGDAILASSVVESLIKADPKREIHILVRKGNESLFTCHPHVGKVLIWDKKKRKYLNLTKVVTRIRKEKYQTVINLQRFFATGLITALSGARQRRGFSKNPLSFFFTHAFEHKIENGVHEIDRNHSLLQGMAGPVPERPRLYPESGDTLAVEQYLHAPFITFAPASVWFTKQFPTQKWVEVLSKVPRQLRIIALGSASDRSQAQEILDSLPLESSLNLCGELSLLQSAALMRRARLNLVNDSAPMHLASAVNSPVAAIYCSTVPDFGFGPLSDQSWVIETRNSLDCRPCGLHGLSKCPQGHFRCANEIQTQAFETIFKSL